MLTGCRTSNGVRAPPRETGEDCIGLITDEIENHFQLGLSSSLPRGERLHQPASRSHTATTPGRLVKSLFFCTDSGPDVHAHVDRSQSLPRLEDFDRVQVHLSNLWEFLNQPRDA
jgi:hypothetical protein